MPAPIHDLTALLCRQEIDWNPPCRTVEERFDPWVRNIRRGVYALYFRNSRVGPVFDKNGGFRRGGEGTCVLFGGGASVKPGKFLGGAVARRYQDADHLHWTRDEQKGLAFRECLQLALHLDLPNRTDDQVERLEKFLKKKVDGFFASGHLHLRPGTTRHGDWRHLRDAPSLDEIRPLLAEALEKTWEEAGGAL